MTITIPDDAFGKTITSPEQARLEFAIALFVGNRASVSRGARIAGLSFLDFQRELGRREIPQHYGMEDYEQDMRTLSEWPLPQASGAKSEDA